MVTANLVLRVARPTDNMEAIVRFYCDGLGFLVLAEFEDHDEFDGVILGHSQSPYHFEFTCKKGHSAGKAPTQDNLLIFYFSNSSEWSNAAAQMQEQGYKSTPSFNPYWDKQGITFEDPDGYRVVLQNASWQV